MQAVIMEFTPIARNDFTAILKREGERNIPMQAFIYLYSHNRCS